MATREARAAAVQFCIQLTPVERFHFVLNRTTTVPYAPLQHYPLPSENNLQYNNQWIWENSIK